VSAGSQVIPFSSKTLRNCRCTFFYFILANKALDDATARLVEWNRKEAKRRQAARKAERSGQRLTNLDVDILASKSTKELDYECGVTRIYWRSDDAHGSVAYLYRNACNGRRGANYECCALCSAWFDANAARIREWFAIAVTIEKRCARYFLRGGQALKDVWDIPVEPQ